MKKSRGLSWLFMPLGYLVQAPYAGPAIAAVRVCQNTVSSEVTTDKDELAAKKKAIDQWIAKAQAYGPDYGLWRLAAEKSLQCFQKNAVFECVAFGAPCIVQNNPEQRPAGKDRKGVPL